MTGSAPLPDGGALRVVDEGAGPPLVLVSGLGGLASFWDEVAGSLAARFRLVRYDHRGVGGSSPLTSETSIAAMADDLVALLDHLGLERVDLVGHSTGGAIAQGLALSHPGRLSRLVLSATFARPCAYMRRLFAGRLDILDRLGLDAYRRHAALVLNAPAWIAEHDAALERALRAAGAGERPGDATTIRRRIDAVLRHDTADAVHRIAVPTLAMVAADDAVTPLHHTRALAAAIPGARLAILPRGGHYAPRAEPALYVDALLAFLAPSSARPPS